MRPTLLIWTCQKNLAADLAWQMAAASPFWTGDSTGLPKGECPQEPIRQMGLGRHGPDSEWPSCPTCGETMIPLCSADPEEEFNEPRNA